MQARHMRVRGKAELARHVPHGSATVAAVAMAIAFNVVGYLAIDAVKDLGGQRLIFAIMLLALVGMSIDLLDSLRAHVTHGECSPVVGALSLLPVVAVALLVVGAFTTTAVGIVRAIGAI